MRTVPYRKDFMEKLGPDEASVTRDMKEHADKLEENVNCIIKLYKTTEQDKSDKV